MATSVIITPPGFSGGDNGGGGGGSDNTFTSPIFEVLGSAGSPAYSFTSYQDRGIFSTPSTLGFAVGGQPQLQLGLASPAAFSRGLTVGGPLGLSSGAAIYNGALSSPDGQVTAPVGSLYLSSNGGPNSTVFYKETGIDENGWRAVKSLDAIFPTFAPAAGPGAPSYAFLNAQGQPTDRGLYAQPGGELGLARGGTALLRVLADNSVRVGAFNAGSAKVDGQLSAADLQVDGASILDGDLSVGGDTTLAGPLSAAGASFAQDVTLLQRLGLPGGPQLTSGTGDPEGSVSAQPGSLYLRTDGVATGLYSKLTGPAAMGWSAVTTASGLPFPLRAPSSAAGAPSFAFSEDDGAGLSFAGGVLTLGTAGLGRLQVLASGAVRIVGALQAQSDASIAGRLSADAIVSGGDVSAGQNLLVSGVTSLGGKLSLPDSVDIITGVLTTPSGNVSAMPGSLYLSNSGGPGSTLFIKEQGSGVTGWTAVAAVASGGGGTPAPLTYPLLAPDGTPGAPSFGFASGPQGLGALADGSLFLATGGAAQLSIDDTGAAIFAASLSVLGEHDVLGATHLHGTALIDGNTQVGGTLNLQSALTATSGAFSSFLSVATQLTLGASTTLTTGTLANPEGNVLATAGSLYLSKTGGTGMTLFVKESDQSGSASSMGWVAASGSSAAGGGTMPMPPPYPLLAPATGAAAPSYAFAAPNGTNSGLFGLANGSVGLSSGGQSHLEVSPTGTVNLLGTVVVQSGSFTSSVAATFADVATFQDDVFFNGDATFAGSISLPGALSVNSLTVTGGTHLVGKLTADAAVSVGTTLSVAGDTTLAALTASGLSTLQAAQVTTLDASGAANFAAGLGVGAAKVLSGSLTSPNGQVSAPQGSIYLSTAGGSNATLWARQSGAATNWSFFGTPGQTVFPLRATTAGSATATAFGFAADTGGSGLFAPSTGALALASGGAAALVLGTDQSASFSASLSVAGNTTLSGTTAMLSVAGSAKFSGATEFVGSALFDQGVNFPGNETIQGGSQANPNGFVTAASGSLYLSSTGGTNKVLWVKETGTLSNTGWTSYGNPAATAPAYPLLAPAGTTAAPNTPYTFDTATTSGMGYNTTIGALTLRSQGVISQQAVGASSGFGNWAPASSDAEQPIQLNAQANVTSNIGFYTQGTLGFLLGYSNFTGANFLAGPWLRAQKAGAPLWLTTCPTTSGTIAPGIKVGSSAASPGYVSINGFSDSLSPLGVAGGVAIGAGVYSATAAPTNGLLVQGPSTFQGNVTFSGGTTGLTVATTFPLAAPTGTTAAPNIPYSFTANTTSGVGYDTTVGATTIYKAGSPILRATSSGVGLGAATPTAANVGLLYAQTALTGVNAGVPQIQVACTSGLGGGFGILDASNVSTSSFSSNLYTGDGVPVCSYLMSLNRPLLTMVGTSYTSIASTAYNVSNSYFWLFGGSGQSASTVGVKGSLAVGGTVATGTAAPANGLLVQGNAGFGGFSATADVRSHVQVNAPSGGWSYYSLYAGGASAANLSYFNNVSASSYLTGTHLNIQNANPFYITVNGAPTYALNVTSNAFVGVGSSAGAASPLGVFGGAAIGSAVAGATAAPANGLLVQGNTIIQGSLTVLSGMPGQVVIVQASTNATATAAQSGTSFIFLGDGTLTLPAAVSATVGVTYTVSEFAASTLKVAAANSSDTLTYLGGSKTFPAATAYTSTAQKGSSVQVICIGAGNWVVFSQQGTWV